MPNLRGPEPPLLAEGLNVMPASTVFSPTDLLNVKYYLWEMNKVQTFSVKWFKEHQKMNNGEKPLYTQQAF